METYVELDLGDLRTMLSRDVKGISDLSCSQLSRFPEDFNELVQITFASDRDRVPKGMIEVIF